MVGSGEQVVNCIVEVVFDLVLMDIYFEGEMDGVQMVMKIWERYQIFVIYFIVFVEDDMLQCVLVSWLFGYLVKFWDICELYVLIQMVFVCCEIEFVIEKSELCLKLVMDVVLFSVIEWLLEDQCMYGEGYLCVLFGQCKMFFDEFWVFFFEYVNDDD